MKSERTDSIVDKSTCEFAPPFGRGELSTTMCLFYNEMPSNSFKSYENVSILSNIVTLDMSHVKLLHI